MLSTFIQGFLISAGLIIAIGAQNVYVLKQGIKREFVFPVAFTCFLCDVVLMMLGVFGLGTLIAGSPMFTKIAAWGGAAFLFWYGARSFNAALKPQAMDLEASKIRPKSLKRAVLITLALSLLNPHVYLDTIVLVGSIAAQYAEDLRPFFGLGAIAASFVWFFSLAYGATLFTPFFKNPKAWQVLDIFTGCIMWGIAGILLFTS